MTMGGKLSAQASQVTARRCPVPGVAAGAARPVTAWRLDRDRLAALTAAVAPAIPVIDAATGPNQGVEGPG